FAPPRLPPVSPPPQARYLPSGEKAAHLFKPDALTCSAAVRGSCLGENSRTFSPVRRLHAATTLGLIPTCWTVTMNSLSGENMIWLGWVLASRQRSSLPVVASQIRAVPSQAAVATHLPSGEYATDVTRSLWPGSGRIGLPQPGSFSSCAA